jgi:ankyrin repeat protein
MMRLRLHESLRKAVAEQDSKTVQKLLRAGARSDSPDEAGDTALHLAARERGDASILRLLVKSRSVRHRENRAGHTPLMVAAMSGNWRAVDVLVEGGARIDHRNGKGESALTFAIVARRPKTVRAILRHEPSQKKCRGWTPLMYAAFEGQASVIRQLLAKNRVTTRDQWGRAPPASKTLEPKDSLRPGRQQLENADMGLPGLLVTTHAKDDGKLRLRFYDCLSQSDSLWKEMSSIRSSKYRSPWTGGMINPCETSDSHFSSGS